MSRTASLTDLTAAGHAQRATTKRLRANDELIALMRATVKPAAGERAGAEAVIEALRPKSPIPSPPAVANALRNAELRTLFLEQVGAFTSTEVARIAGNDARNPHALASRWRAQGRIFGVHWGEQTLFPAFQFTADGAPHPAIAPVLRAFGGRAGPWQMALWFVLPSPHLPGHAAPVAVLDDAGALESAVRADLDLPEF